MKKTITNFINYWLPPIIWMVSIYYFSSRTHFGITNTFFLDFAVFKTLHMIEYGFLFFLLFRALNKTTDLSFSKQLALAGTIAVLYAMGDELHQTSVPTREGKVRDIFIDTGGILITYWWVRTNFESVVKKLL